MFVDVAKVFVKAGRGGDGIISFRHEIYIDKGGPNGGDGGRGGDVIFKATENLNTLLDFRYKPELKAENGANGGKQNKHGKSGENLIVLEIMSLKIATFLSIKSSLDSPGFWFAPAEIIVISLAEVSSKPPAFISLGFEKAPP